VSKSRKKNVNPNRIPVTMADVEKAKKKGTEDAMRFVTSLMLYVLIDKHDAPFEDIQQLVRELNHCAQCVNEGLVKWKDIERLVFEEYGVELQW
jgi:hypothetical protein